MCGQRLCVIDGHPRSIVLGFAKKGGSADELMHV
jgi:hypothetical protein